MNKKNRIILFAAMIVAAVSQTFAQGNGLAGINEATSMVTSYFDPGTKLIYAIGAVVGLIGGIKVYGKFSSGDPDTSKTAASWFGACLSAIKGVNQAFARFTPFFTPKNVKLGVFVFFKILQKNVNYKAIGISMDWQNEPL